MTTGTIVTPTNVLVLGPVDRHKAGVYMCKAINHGMTHSRNISTRIIVNYGPDSVNVNVSSKFNVTEGHVAPRITCTTSCWPECAYTWRNATSGATMATSRVLDLGHVNRYMTATYTCKASNNDISLHKETNITMNVYYGPDRVHVSQPSEFIVTEGQLAPNITCKGDCLPECLYSWTNLTSGTTVALRESLVLGHSNRYMAGVYMCKANNAATCRNVNGSTRMFVIYGPDSLNFNVPRQYTVTEGEVVPTVTCSADCWPGCTYTWRNMTYGDTLPNTGMLTLGRVNKYAAGEYSCDAYNNGNGLKKSTSIRIIVNYASIDSHQQTIFISAVTGGCGACIVILIAVVCCCRRYRHRCTRTGQQNESAIIRKDTAASHFSNAETITNAEHTYTGLQRDQQNVRVVEYQNVTVEPTDHDYEQLDDDLYVNQLSIS
ncbi:carcinoembryonic antigen-related cell adhesion molecule 20-like [Dreissena polymorpha]|uniref:carcinoembryonic antigen-related cell adhesion molecule 20-like n=1 Tax=Dreissena polymorpha TaxID=45954 RepID=UPI00226456D6|nr:carcinoembryonic antigen-related cell adhesion molecule 20-like [Dreissena polymorpha]